MNSHPPQIIAIAGKAGSGKDTVAEYIGNKFNKCYIESFAAPLKRACAEAFGIPLNTFFDPIAKEIEDLPWNTSPRKIAQFVGTEMFRDQIPHLLPETGNDFWVQRMAYLLAGDIQTEGGANYDENDTIVIPDLRFQNEYDWLVSQNAVIIHLTRPNASDTVGIPGHASELGFTFDSSFPGNWHITNDKSRGDLYEEVDIILKASNLELFYNKPIQL